MLLLSLRANLSPPGISSKPSVVASVQPEGVSETTRCTAVAWVPRSDAGMFVAAFNTGNIYVYKKVREEAAYAWELRASVA